MKTSLIIFAGLSFSIGFIVFGSLFLSRVVRWLGWPQDVLAALGFLFIILAGISITGWRIGVQEDASERQRIESKNNSDLRS